MTHPAPEPERPHGNTFALEVTITASGVVTHPDGTTDDDDEGVTP